MFGFVVEWEVWGQQVMVLIKVEMVEKLFDEVGLNKCEVKEFVDVFFDVL